MDTIEATKMVMSRIQNIDPDNASKIMGYILIQEQGENEIIRLAFGPENLLASVVKQAKTFLEEISSNTCSSPSSNAPFAYPRVVIPNDAYHRHMNHPPLSPHSPWSSSSGSFRSSPTAASYASVVNGGNSFSEVTEEEECSVPQDQDAILFPYPNSPTDCGDTHHHLHRRSCSVNDAFVGGWRPCMYFARGFCKNGTSCNFLHGNGNVCFGEEICLGGSSSPTSIVGSPTGGNIDEFEDFLRIKAIQQQQQRVAAMAAGGPHTFPFNRCFNFLHEAPRSPSAAAALMMGEDIHKFARFRPDRHDLAMTATGLGNSSSRQIYLTFPADSTFKEEDVSNYFSIFGPVQDVRIPYQQKRMFGFVTFVLPETVKAILAKGNPHFVCDSRVLVKPYKEKGKIPDKKHHHQHHIDRGDFSALESAEPFDHIPFGARMFDHDMMLRRKLEGPAELQQAIEFQERNLMNMQLTDHPRTNQILVPHDSLNVVSGEEVNGSCIQELTEGSEPKLPKVKDDDSEDNSSNGSGKESSDLNEHQSIFDHILPDNLFASPTKTAASSHQCILSANLPEADDHDGSAILNQISASTAANVNSTVFNMKSCYLQMPRSFCGQEAVEM